jgi:TetR/AcrR family transcriptional repressor of nem operon
LPNNARSSLLPERLPRGWAQGNVTYDSSRWQRAIVSECPTIGTWDLQKETAGSSGQTLSFEKLIDAYVSDAHRKNPGSGCAFSALAPEIARSDKRTRALTTEQVRKDLELLAGLLPGKDRLAARSRAMLTFSGLVGAMALARAVSDEVLSREILKTVADLLKHPA